MSTTVFLITALVCAATAAAQDVTVVAATGSTPPPDALAAPIRAALLRESLEVKRGDDLVRFWTVRALPLSGSATADWSNVPAGALVGAMQIESPLPDIRGNPIAPGVYTLRFALQPQDGDHMGVSPYRQFLVVAPAAEDQSVEPVGYEGAVAMGKKASGRSHPAVLSIDPPSVSVPPPAPVVKTEEGHTAVVLGVDCTHEGAPAARLSFGLILVGRIEY
ncbi:MAG TPA: hypothetical protein VNK41_03685 [Vicinamibacterales bacterium]|nr:hypothetical protein [Vicinamibacterales bacterium]